MKRGGAIRRYFRLLRRFLGGVRLHQALERHKLASAELDRAVREVLRK